MPSPTLLRHLIVSPNLPPNTEVQLPSGLWQPARYHAERYKPAEGGVILSFLKDDVQVVSGKVVTSPAKIVHRLSLPRPVAEKFGKRLSTLPSGLVECDIEYRGPQEGDAVFFGYGTWGNAEFSRDTYLLRNELLGRIEASCIDMFESCGKWICPGPWVILEPIPDVMPETGELSGVLIAGLVQNVGKVVAVPEFHIFPLPKIGEIVRFVGPTRPSTPNPFSDGEYLKVSLENVCCTEDYTLSKEEIAARWEAIVTHNNFIAKGMPDIDNRTAEQIMDDEIGERADRAKEIINKRFRSRRFSKR